MIEDPPRRAWQELPSTVKEEALQLAKRGDVHSDNHVVDAALRALRHDYRRYVVIRSLSLWIGSPIFSGILLAMVYLGGRIADVPWWLVVLGVVAASLVASHQALRERGALPRPIGSDLPFAMASAFARTLGQNDLGDSRPRYRERVILIGYIVLAALAVAFLIVRSLDRPADLRSGLIIAMLFGLLVGISYFAAWIKKRWQARSSDRSGG